MMIINNIPYRANIVAFTCIWLLGLPGQSSAEQPMLPTNGSVTSQFGWRVDPFNGTNRFHAGLDIAAPFGSPIRASQRAVVAYSGAYRGYGNVVALAHGKGLYTLYGHAATVYVKPDQVVEKGQVIATVGSTGRSTGPHLHFEVHQRGQYQNPAAYLSTTTSNIKAVAYAKPVLKAGVSTNMSYFHRPNGSAKNPYTASTTVFLSQEALYADSE